MRNKKGQVDLILMMAIFVIFVIAAGIMWFIMSSLNTEIMEDPDMAAYLESIEYAETSFGFLNWGSALIFMGMMISLFISYYKIGSAPYWFIFHLIVIIISIVGAVFLANVYYDLSLDTDLNQKMQTDMIMPYYIILYYPMIIGIVGFVSVVILVAKWAKEKGGASQLPGYG
jgi:hypothetical protein